MGEKIRILQLQSAAKLAGTEVSTERLISSMNKDEFENDICFFLEDGPIAEKYRQNNYNVQVLGFNCKNVLPVIKKLNHIIKTGKYDVINIYGYKVNILGRIIAAVNGNKNVITAQRSIDGQRKWIHSFIDKVTSIFVKLYISNSEAGRNILIRREKISQSKIITIYNGIKVENFGMPVDKQLMYEKLGISEIMRKNRNTKVIAVVGNLLIPKGHTFMIDSVKQLKEEGIDDFVVIFAGEGELRSSLENKVNSLGLADKVIFLGSRKDIPEILSTCDIFVLPSLWEGVPGSIMEAMASKLPVVATDVGGVSELVLNGTTGFVVESQRPDQLSQKIKLLLKNQKMREKMGEEGYERIKNFFSLQKMVSEYEKAYKAVAEKENIL